MFHEGNVVYLCLPVVGIDAPFLYICSLLNRKYEAPTAYYFRMFFLLHRLLAG